MKERQNGAPWGLYLRVALWIVATASWPVMLLEAWSAFATLPSPERLETSRLAAIPTLRTVARLVMRSAAELAVVLALLWPWRERWYTRRLLGSAGLLAVWFVATAPLVLTRLEWVHRRWLVFLVALQLAFVVVRLTVELLRRLLSGTGR